MRSIGLRMAVEQVGKNVEEWVSSGGIDKKYWSNLDMLYNFIILKTGGFLPSNLRSYLK